MSKRVSALVGYDLHIDGDEVPAAGHQTYATTNPYDREPWALAADATLSDIDAAVAAARAALDGEWGATTWAERAWLLRALADVVERDASRLAEIETRDNGELLRETSAQTASLPLWLRYFAGVAETVRGATIPIGKPNFLVYTQQRPVGVVAAIIPWNSPLLLLVFKLAPALAAGCTTVVKPSEYTPATAVELARLCAEAGLPPGGVNVVTGSGATAGQALAEHPGVDMIAFTGSTATGIEVARTAAGRLARSTLELGGKSAQLVFADADLESASNGIIAGIFAASGQTCIAGSRLLVARDVHDELLERVVTRARSIRLGDPMQPDSEMGPLANERQLDTVREFVEEALRDHAELRCGGGRRRDGRTLLCADCTRWRRPIDASRPGGSGRSAACGRRLRQRGRGGRDGKQLPLWARRRRLDRDVGRAHRVAGRLRAGTIWVNAYRVLAPQVPFGGFGESGWGRENGLEALRLTRRQLRSGSKPKVARATRSRSDDRPRSPR